MDELEPSEKLDKIIEHNKWYNFEGPSGLDRLENLASILGYTHRYNDSIIHHMLEDNPGMIDAMVEFIREYASCWEDKFDEYIAEEIVEEIVEETETENEINQTQSSS